MDTLTQDDLRELLEAEGEWCVSILMPTVRTGAEVQQNPIRFRNLLRQAEDQLGGLGVRTPDIERLLRPAQELLNDVEFWRQMGEGLAVFSGPDFFGFRRLPLILEELVVVKRQFHLKPLLKMLSEDGRFFVLALSQDQVRLLEGTRYSVSEISLDSLPESLADALQYDRTERQVRAASGGARGTAFGFGGNGEEENKLDILRYFQIVDRGLSDLLTDKRIPLVLAGVDYLLPIYREANTYPSLLDDWLTGSPETLSAKELHQRAWELVKPRFAKAREEQLALYQALSGRSDERASNNLKTIVQAAHDGRIAALFVAQGVQQWGVYRSHSHNVHVHPSQQPGDHDLLDLAAVQTYANGGQVFVLENGQVPGGEAWAAVFRY